MNKLWAFSLLVVAALFVYTAGLPGLVIAMAILSYVAVSLTVLPKVLAIQAKLKSIENRLTHADEPEEESLVQFPDPAPHGWDNYMVYPRLKRYERDYCFGGPPARTEIWEYEIKESQVFHRLVDARKAFFTDPEYEVVNGTVLENAVDTCGSTEGLKRQVQWHLCTGRLSSEILVIHAQPRLPQPVH